MDIMELLYEKGQTSALYNSPKYLAASILVASYVITVPKQRWEFPVLPWDAYKMIGSNHESGPRGGFTRPDHMKCCGLERSSSLPVVQYLPYIVEVNYEPCKALHTCVDLKLGSSLLDFECHFNKVIEKKMR